MLTLPIKKKWFDMILSGEKKEEYREIKPYYDSRFYHIKAFPKEKTNSDSIAEFTLKIKTVDYVISTLHFILGLFFEYPFLNIIFLLALN